MNVIQTRIDEVSYRSVDHQVSKWAQTNNTRYICIANVHTVMEAYDSTEFRKVINNSDLITPDGMPLVWMMRLKGVKGQQRVYGPTLMLHILESSMCKGIPVGFFGGEPHVLDVLVKRLKTWYPELKIVFLFSPPFRKMSPQEDNAVVEQINHSGAKILFVGLGCPKQETWMAEHRGKVNAVMLGVGAAFDFHAGLKPQAPLWVQRLGLEWFFRLLTEPGRLWKRYLHHNPRFVVLAIVDLLGLLKKIG